MKQLVETKKGPSCSSQSLDLFFLILFLMERPPSANISWLLPSRNYIVFFTAPPSCYYVVHHASFMQGLQQKKRLFSLATPQTACGKKNPVFFSSLPSPSTSTRLKRYFSLLLCSILLFLWREVGCCCQMPSRLYAHTWMGGKKERKGGRKECRT